LLDQYNVKLEADSFVSDQKWTVEKTSFTYYLVRFEEISEFNYLGLNRRFFSVSNPKGERYECDV